MTFSNDDSDLFSEPTDFNNSSLGPERTNITPNLDVEIARNDESNDNVEYGIGVGMLLDATRNNEISNDEENNNAVEHESGDSEEEGELRNANETDNSGDN
jgi:hypothetical protein